MAAQAKQPPLHLSATFVPGHEDDFNMPELISPLPQRITPELPLTIQNNLARLELDAGPTNRLSGLQSPPLTGQRQGESADSGIFPTCKPVQTSEPNIASRNGPQEIPNRPILPTIPPLQGRPINVPPSNEEKENILEAARYMIVHSTDPEAQLEWAQDALVWAEINEHDAARVSALQTSHAHISRSVSQIRTDAMNIVTFLADQHHPKAEFFRGTWLEYGSFGYRMDKKEAFYCYQRSAQRGYARAEYRMGMQFEVSNDLANAIKHYQAGVRAGDSACHYRIGMMLLTGQHGHRLDYNEGLRMMHYAANTADENAPHGTYILGMLQARELSQFGIPEQFQPLDLEGARRHLERAAYLGFAKAQTKMGLAYELCQLGCDFNPAMSLHYNALASRQGEIEADMAISKWFLCGYEGLFSKNEELAFRYAQRAARAELPTAEFAMGYFFEVGIFVSRDLKMSQTWYEKAAKHGNQDASARIDGIIRSKTLTRHDHENVAIARIQSQYGTHRQKRPDRFKSQSSTRPTASDGPHLSNRTNHDAHAPSHYVLPYPLEPHTNLQPSTVTPYPTNDRPARPSNPEKKAIPHTTYQNYTRKTESVARPPSPAESETSFGDKNYRGSAFPTFKPTPSPYKVAQNGRGMEGTTPSTFLGTSPHENPRPQKSQSDKTKPLPSRLEMTPRLRPSPRPPDNSSQQTLSPGRPHHEAETARQNLRNTPAEQNFSAGMPHSPSQLSPATPSYPHPGYSSRNSSRNTSPARQPVSGGRPEGDDGPVAGAAGHGDAQHTPTPPLKSHVIQDTAQHASNLSRPPNKGPRTFQEMGVPAAKTNSECIIM